MSGYCMLKKSVNISSFVIQNTVKFRVRLYKMMSFHAFRSVFYALRRDSN